jgi:hypothetical protein
VLELRLSLKVMVHHGVFWWRMGTLLATILHGLIIIVIRAGVFLSHVILGPFVLVCAAILFDLY